MGLGAGGEPCNGLALEQQACVQLSQPGPGVACRLAGNVGLEWMRDLLVLVIWPGPGVGGWKSRPERALSTLYLFCRSCHCQGLCQLESWGGHLSQAVLIGMGRVGVLVVDWHRGSSRWVNNLLSVQEAERLCLALGQLL